MIFNTEIIKKLFLEELQGNTITRTYITKKHGLTDNEARAYYAVYLADKQRNVQQTNNLVKEIEQKIQKRVNINVPENNPEWIRKSEKYSFLILPDIHAPFDSEYAMQKIIDFAKKTKPDVILCTGDEVDFHGSSFHETLTDALGVDDELYYAKRNLRRLTDALLPYVTDKHIYCVDSNHGAIPARKLENAMVSKQFLRSKKEVLDLPEWYFTDYIETNNFGLSHGTGGKNVIKRVLNRNKSWIIGHFHTLAYLNFIDSKRWAMQLSCIFNPDTYAAAYAKAGQELSPIIWSYGYIERGNKPHVYTI